MGRKIVVACGGTGGHAFPGLAVARELARRGHSVTVWTSGRAIEGSVLKGWEGPVFASGARQLSVRNLFANIRAILRCARTMRRERPDALIAMGSYASIPPVLAAAWCGVPVALHEANTVPGRAVDVLGRFAKVVAISFAETAQALPGRTTELTGLPVRAEVATGEPFGDAPDGSFRVFVTGGSQGAHRLNELLTAAMPLLKDELAKRRVGRTLWVMHQTGVADEETVRAAYEKAQIPARVTAFEHEMGRAFATADVVVARAGASTCFELALTGKPTFFVPLPSAMRNHQHFNAAAFAEKGAAFEGFQDTLTPRAVANWLATMAEKPERLAEMRRQMRALAEPQASAKVADLVERIAG